MSFSNAARTAVAHGLNMASRRPDTATATTVTWNDAGIGIVLLIAVQAALFAWTFMAVGQFVPVMLRDVALTVALSFAVPFFIFLVVARLSGQSDKLPAIFLFLALMLTAVQIMGALVSLADSSSSLTVAILAVGCGYAARGLLGAGWGITIAIAVVVAIGTMAASYVLFALPTGQAILAQG
jgi:hypothetical protein